MRRLGFVQADPIRAPARAQDLILRQRVKAYRAGDLERRYPSLKLEEDVLYAYGFMPRSVWQLLHAPKVGGLSVLETRVLDAVRSLGETHPRQLDEQFGRKPVTNAWGGLSNSSKQVLEALHRRGLLRVARRDSGVRVYQVAPPAADTSDRLLRFRKLVLVAAQIFAPAPRTRLHAALATLRRRGMVDSREAHAVVEDLLGCGELEQASVDGVGYVWPPTSGQKAPAPRVVRFLAPFDPVVWDRQRFEHLWGWPYRFEAYTPKAKRVRGYYAMPLLWGDRVIGWANISSAHEQLDVELGFVDKRPRTKAFTTQLDAEFERLRAFLRSRDGA